MGLYRSDIIFSGRVQGVGFRFTAYRASQQFPIRGWIRNLPDGTVQCVLEGTDAEIREFLDELKARIADHSIGRIDDVNAQTTPITSHEFSKFEIR